MYWIFTFICSDLQMTFENIGRLFASLEPGPTLDFMDELFAGLLKGVRASPINFPGTAYRHALEVPFGKCIDFHLFLVLFKITLSECMDL